MVENEAFCTSFSTIYDDFLYSAGLVKLDRLPTKTGYSSIIVEYQGLRSSLPVCNGRACFSSSSGPSIRRSGIPAVGKACFQPPNTGHAYDCHVRSLV